MPLAFAIPGYALGAVRRADGSGSWLVHARDLERDRPVLLKVLARPPGADADPAARRVEERLRREARAAARVHHPAVVRVFDLIETPDCLALVMEAVDAPDVDAELRAVGPFSVARAVRVARDVARGLAELHRAGVIHRDVTPANVLVPAQGPAVLVDLGLARLRDGGGPLTAPDVLLGTPAYMAPEQAEDPRGADARADCYALGATTFAMLAGRPPFTGEGLEPLRQALRGGAPDVRNFRPEVPAALARLVARCLARAPADRPAGAAEVAGALDAVIADWADGADGAAGDPTDAALTPGALSAPTPVAVAAVGDPARARPGLSLGFALGMAVTVGLAGVSWWLLPSRRARPTPASASVVPPEPARAPPAAPPADRPPPVAPTPSPAPDREALARRWARVGDACAARGQTPWERASWMLAACGAYAAVLQGAPETFEAARLRNLLHERRRLLRLARERAEAALRRRIAPLLDRGRYREAFAEVEADTAADAAARAALRASIEQRAGESYQRTLRFARARVEHGDRAGAVAMLTDEADRTLPALAAALAQEIAALRAPARDAPPAAGGTDARPIEALWRDCDECCLLGEPETAIALLGAALADRRYAAAEPLLRQRLAEAAALNAMLDRLRDGLAAQPGLRIALPGGTVTVLVSAGRGEVVLRREGAVLTVRVLERGARWTEQLLRLAVRRLSAEDALALGLLLHLDGADAAAAPYLRTARAGGCAADRLLGAVEARLAAERAERAADGLDRARAARAREDAERVLDALERMAREGCLPAEGPGAVEVTRLGDWARLRLSGLEGLLRAQVRPQDRRGRVALAWRGDAAAADATAEADGLQRLAPRWRELADVEVVATEALPLAGRVAVAIESANGLRAELRLLPDGRAALVFDGTEVRTGADGALPLRLARDGRSLRVSVGGRDWPALDWAGEGPFHVWTGPVVADTEIRASGALDPAWIRSARLAALQPGAPGNVRCVGPPRDLRVRWDPPARGRARGYRVYVAVGDDADGRLLAPVGAFRHSVLVEHPEIRLPLRNAWVAGVYVEAIGSDGRPGPPSAVCYAADWQRAGASAIAVGSRGEVYVAVAGRPLVVRLRADGLPEWVPGTPDRGARAAAPAALAATRGRYGTVLAMSDPGGEWCWAWGPGLEARPFGHGTGARFGALTVDALGNWWAADTAGRRLYSYWGQGLRRIHWIGSPDGPAAFSAGAPRAVAVLPDARVAAADPQGDRVVLFRRMEGWYATDRVLGDLPGARELAAGGDQRLYVATGTAVTRVALEPEGDEAGRVVLREVEGERLGRVVGLAAAPEGGVWVLDAGGRLLRIRP